MPKRKKPNWKYPCSECKKPVKSNQQGVSCNTCKKWVHFKCTDLTQSQCEFLEASNDDFLFFCLECKPRQFYSEEIFETFPNILDSPNTIRSNSNPSDSESELEFSNANSCDFTYEYDDGSDSDSRGLDFDGLPVQNACPNRNNKTTKIFDMHKQFSVRTIYYKYPCVVCHGPCRNNTQDSISCSVCDEWTHQKCSNLTIQQFQEYCKPENSEMRFYCDNCLFGSIVNTENQTSLNAAEIGLLDTNDIYNLSPNSIFRDMEDVITNGIFYH